MRRATVSFRLTDSVLEDDLEAFEGVRGGRLLQLLVGDGLLPDLAEEELIAPLSQTRTRVG
jgi:hypothetical protein